MRITWGSLKPAPPIVELVLHSPLHISLWSRREVEEDSLHHAIPYIGIVIKRCLCWGFWTFPSQERPQILRDDLVRQLPNSYLWVVATAKEFQCLYEFIFGFFCLKTLIKLLQVLYCTCSCDARKRSQWAFISCGICSRQMHLDMSYFLLHLFLIFNNLTHHCKQKNTHTWKRFRLAIYLR